MKLILSIFTSLLAATTGFLGAAYITEHSGRLEAEANLVLTKSELQKTSELLQMANRRADDLRGNIEKSLGNQEQKEQVESVSGIYYLSRPGTGASDQKLDLRSDGSAIRSTTSASGYEYSRRPITWELTGDRVVAGGERYRVEGIDLVDNGGNRWIRRR